MLSRLCTADGGSVWLDEAVLIRADVTATAAGAWPSNGDSNSSANLLRYRSG